MPRGKQPQTRADDDELDDDEAEEFDDEEDVDDDEGDEDESDDDEDEDDEDDDDAEPDSERNVSARGTSSSARDRAPLDEPAHEPVDDPPTRRQRRSGARARGPGGMGRPSTGPRIKAARRRDDGAAAGALSGDGVTMEAPETELAPDISSWPGTAEAAKMVGRHTSTIKIWRSQGRVRALQDGSGCWRYNPDDLAEAVDVPDQTDPGSVLAAGMTAIVQHGTTAGDRLLTMTEIATDGLKDAAAVLRGELERAYRRIAELEEKLAKLRDEHVATHTANLDHERRITRMNQRHELEVIGAKETSERVSGLLTILGPIAVSIGQRLLGNVLGAEASERVASGAPAVAPVEPGSSEPAAASTAEVGAASTPTAAKAAEVPIETRIMAAMARLSDAIRRLDSPALKGLRAMMPEPVALALDAVVAAESDGSVGRALATIITAAQNLSDLQFAALRPIAPADIAACLVELRELLRQGHVTESRAP